MKRALVTGAAGFLGHACVRALTMRGYQVSGVGRRPAPEGFEGTDWLRADLLNAEDRKRLLADARPSHLVHLAWDVASPSYLQSRENARWSAASVDLLDRALDSGVQRIVGAGTCLESAPQIGSVTKLTRIVSQRRYTAAPSSKSLRPLSAPGTRALVSPGAAYSSRMGPKNLPQNCCPRCYAASTTDANSRARMAIRSAISFI